MRRLWLILAACAAAQAAPALAQQTPPQAAPVMNTASPGDKALVSSTDKMGSGMAQPLSGNTDQDFAQMMLAHHQGAVAMAQAELRYGQDPFLRQLAQHIITSQTAEIKQMQTWQAKHPLSK